MLHFSLVPVRRMYMQGVAVVSIQHLMSLSGPTGLGESEEADRPFVERGLTLERGQMECTEASIYVIEVQSPAQIPQL